MAITRLSKASSYARCDACPSFAIIWADRAAHKHVQLAQTPTPTPVPVFTPPYFAKADDFWKEIGPNPAIDPNSPLWSGYLARGGHFVNAIDTGSPIYDIPTTGTAPELTVKVTMYNKRTITVRVPAGAKPAPGGDAAMAVIDHPRGKVYDFWQYKQTSSSTATTSAASILDLDGNGTTDSDIGGGQTGSGISRALGVITAADWEYAKTHGYIPHALVFSTSLAAPTHRPPATKSDGKNIDQVPNPIPEGARIQLTPLDVSRLPAYQRYIDNTVQRYGAYLIDNGGGKNTSVAIIASGLAPSVALTDDWATLQGIDWTRVRVLAG